MRAAISTRSTGFAIPWGSRRSWFRSSCSSRAIFVHWLWVYALVLFLLGWTLQFIGHAFERKEPEFFHDWRFLFVGVRWWWAKIHGKA